MRALVLLVCLLVAGPALAKKPEPPAPPAWKCTDAVSTDYGKANDALGTPADAVPLFAAVLAKEPQCGVALLGQGRALLGAGKPAEAIAPLTTASTLFADKIETHVWLGRAKLAAGDHDGALAAAKAAIVLKPGSVDAQRVAQDAVIAKKDYAQAHQLLADARKVSNVVTWNCLDGMISAAEGDVPKAQEWLTLCDGVPDRAIYDALAAKIGVPATVAVPAP